MKRKTTNPRIVVIILLAIVAVGLLAGMVVFGPRRSSLGLETGKYRMTIAVRAANEATAREIDSEVDMTVNKDGGILIVNPRQAEFPIIGKIENNVFSATLKDAGGSVVLCGALAAYNIVTGTLASTELTAGQPNIQGTFTVAPRNVTGL